MYVNDGADFFSQNENAQLWVEDIALFVLSPKTYLDSGASLVLVK